VRVPDEESAKKEMLSIARRMADAGQIMLSCGSDEFL
ncbi:flagellar motor switch protein FliG, partial [Vibrio parahaemolyticus]|nr:flagellar motor switch protein FliG [Vibrio parahaemolyticus]